MLCFKSDMSIGKVTVPFDIFLRESQCTQDLLSFVFSLNTGTESWTVVAMYKPIPFALDCCHSPLSTTLNNKLFPAANRDWFGLHWGLGMFHYGYVMKENINSCFFSLQKTVNVEILSPFISCCSPQFIKQTRCTLQKLSLQRQTLKKYMFFLFCVKLEKK